MKVIELDIGLIKPYENNAKMHPDSQIDNVATSIKKYGWQQPIVVDKNYTIIIGHCRHLAAQRLGLTTVPVVVADNLDDKQVKALRLVDNKSNESGWDLDLLKAEIPTLDLEDFTFDWGIPEEEPEVHDDEDFDVDVAMPVEPISKAGDIYELGDHRLMCGDSTSAEEVKTLMDGKLADLIETDPPYNVAIGKKGKQYKERGGYDCGMTDRTILNDDMDDASFREFLDKVMVNFYNSIKPGGSIYVFHADTEGFNFRGAFKDAGFKLSECLIWKKNNFVLGRCPYHYMHEPILFGWKEGAAHYFVDDRTQTTILEYDRPKASELHPTMKPVPLVTKLITNSSHRGDLVLDLFGGSGTTLIACEQLGRRCRMMEYDPVYCDVIIKRWETLTGKKARKVN